MIDQINKLIDETDSTRLAELYTNIFYACFANTFVSSFSQTTNALRIRKITKEGYVDVMIIIESSSDSLPERPDDSVKFYDLLNVVGGNRKMAKISPIIQFKALPKHFLNVDKWLNSLSTVSIDINIYSNYSSGKNKEETFSVNDLKIIESYEVEHLSITKTVNGSVVDTSSKNPALFTVTLSDWIVEALSKDYLRLSVMDNLRHGKDLLPIVT